MASKLLAPFFYHGHYILLFLIDYRSIFLTLLTEFTIFINNERRCPSLIFKIKVQNLKIIYFFKFN